jgi:DNA anti-recombination protein RmuC
MRTLQAIVLGLKGMKIEERAKEITQHLGQLQGDFARFKDEFVLLGKHLSHAQANYQSAEKRLEQLDQKLLSAHTEQKEVPESRPEERKAG